MDRCTCGEMLLLKPIPGSTGFPRRLECPMHGYVFREKRNDKFGIQEFPDEIIDGEVSGGRSI